MKNIIVNAISDADRSDDPIERLEQLIRGREYLDLKIEEAIIEARTTDRWKGQHVDHVPGRTIETQHNDEFGIASWQRIADALGVSRQSAHRKYAHLVDASDNFCGKCGRFEGSYSYCPHGDMCAQRAPSLVPARTDPYTIRD